MGGHAVIADQKEQTEEQNKLVEKIVATFNELKAERRTFEPIWREITDYIYPRLSGWDYSVDSDITAGEKIFDGTAIACLTKLSDGIFGWLVSPSIDWLKVAPKDRKDEDNKPFMEYLRDIELYLYDVFNRSNFYDAASEAINTGCAIGTSVVYAEEAERLNRPVYTSLHPREVYISENEYQEADVLYRLLEMTARQCVATFGDKMGKKFTEDAHKKPEEKVRILHAIFPRGTFGIISDQKPFASVYLLMGSGRNIGSGTHAVLIDEGGLDFQHFEAWRFRRSSGQTYGTCPSMDSIYDVKTMNLMAKTLLDAAQLAARPPMYGPESLRGNSRIRPGSFTYGPMGAKPEPIVSTMSYPIGMDAYERRAAIVREHFKTDYFQSISQIQQSSRDRTATEIMEIKAESAAVLGSVIGRIQSEFLEPLVRLTLLIEKNAGRLPKPPAELDPSLEFSFQFVGPLAQAQRKYIRVNGYMNGLSQATQLAQMAPDVLMNFDFNHAAREIAIANGYPHEGLVDKKLVQKAQAQAQQARAQQAQMEAENQRLAAAGGASRAAEPGSPASAMMGGS